MKHVWIGLAAFFLVSCGPGPGKGEGSVVNVEDHEKLRVPQKEADTTEAGKAGSYFPFHLHQSNGYVITAGLESPELYPLYYDLFQQYGYEGNGYAWEGIISQILEKADPDLLKQIGFDSEAGMFYARVKSKSSQERFGKLMGPIFSDTAKLKAWLKKADRSRIDD